MNSLREFFLNNIGLKGISVLLAFLLWLNIASEQTVQRTLTLPVEFVNMPTNLEIANEYPRSVDVVVRSERRRTAFDDRQLAVVMDMGGASPGTEIIPLSANHIRNRPFGVEVLSINPARIRLQIERTSRKIVKIEPEIVGEPLEGYELTGLRLIPSEVVVTGPDSRVQQVSVAVTEPINLDGRHESFALDVYVDIDDPGLRIENTSSVRALVSLEEKRRTETVPGVAVVIEPREAARFQTQPTRVAVQGTVPLSFTSELSAEDFRVVIRVADLDPEEAEQRVVPIVVTPEDLTGVFRVETIRPESVTVRRTNR